MKDFKHVIHLKVIPLKVFINLIIIIINRFFKAAKLKGLYLRYRWIHLINVILGKVIIIIMKFLMVVSVLVVMALAIILVYVICLFLPFGKECFSFLNNFVRY